MSTIEAPFQLPVSEEDSSLSVEKVFKELFVSHLTVPLNVKGYAHPAVRAEVRRKESDTVESTWEFCSVGDNIFHIRHSNKDRSIRADFVEDDLVALSESIKSNDLHSDIETDPSDADTQRTANQLLYDALNLRYLENNDRYEVVFKNMIGRDPDKAVLKPVRSQQQKDNIALIERLEDATGRTADIRNAKAQGKPAEHLSYLQAYRLVENAALNGPREGTVFPLPQKRPSPLLTYLEKKEKEDLGRSRRAKVAYDAMNASRPPSGLRERIQPLGPHVSKI